MFTLNTYSAAVTHIIIDVPERLRGVGFESKVLVLVSRCTVTTSAAVRREINRFRRSQ